MLFRVYIFIKSLHEKVTVTGNSLYGNIPGSGTAIISSARLPGFEKQAYIHPPIF